MTIIDNLHNDGERQRAAASNACDAAQDLARSANAHVITAPVAYDVLGNIKMLLHHLQEVTDHIPVGLGNSLNEELIHVYDRDIDGHDRDPLKQIETAGPHFHGLTGHLQEAYKHAEAAQQAIAWQGYHEAELGCLEVKRDAPVQDPLLAAFPQPAAITPTPAAASGARMSSQGQLALRWQTNDPSGRGSSTSTRQT